MVSIYVHRDGATARASAVDPAWLKPGSGAYVWVDLSAPTAEEAALLSDPFGFHPLSVEDAIATTHAPKVESYDGYLYLVLHGIDSKRRGQAFATHDTDFFLGQTFLVTVHDGTTRSIPEVAGVCERLAHMLGEGPASLMHRIVDTMVDHYRPEIDELEGRIDHAETRIFKATREDMVRRILALKREVATLRRITLPQRDAVGRLARREFPLIEQEVAYRFRDVHDQLVRIADESLIFQDRISSMLEAYLSTVSNRLNQVMKVLTIITTIFMPLTLLSGMFGMNVPLPAFPGDPASQFWGIAGLMVLLSGGMLGYFRWKDWL